MTTRRRTRPTIPKVSAGGGKKASAPASSPATVSKAKARRARKATPAPAPSSRAKPVPKAPRTRTPTAKAGKPAARKPSRKPSRKLSRHPEAIRSRKRRREQRGITDALRAEELARKERAKETRKRKRKGAPIVSERETAIGWLEALRNVAASLFPVSLTITDAEASARTPWLVVGRFDFEQAISYADLGAVVDAWDGDAFLTARIHPERLSQIRIIYNDPHDVRVASDSVVSKTGAWEYILSDLRNELIGFAPDDPDALAVRYQETAVQLIYVYFSTELVAYRDAWRGPTQTVKLR